MSEVQQPESQDQISGPPQSNESAQNIKLIVEPLHHPKEMAHVEVPHNVENVPHGTTLMTGKALLAKKMAATGTSFYSPSDSLISPCTQKLSSQKGKRWANAKAKPTVFGKSNLNTSSSMLSPQKPTTIINPNDQESEDGPLKPSSDEGIRIEGEGIGMIKEPLTDQVQN